MPIFNKILNKLRPSVSQDKSRAMAMAARFATSPAASIDAAEVTDVLQAAGWDATDLEQAVSAKKSRIADKKEREEIRAELARIDASKGSLTERATKLSAEAGAAWAAVRENERDYVSLHNAMHAVNMRLRASAPADLVKRLDEIGERANVAFHEAINASNQAASAMQCVETFRTVNRLRPEASLDELDRVVSTMAIESSMKDNFLALTAAVREQRRLHTEAASLERKLRAEAEKLTEEIEAV